MEKKFPDFDPKEVIRLAKSPAGQQLLAALRQADGETLQKASAQAAAGDMENAKNTLDAMLADPKLRALLQQLGR